MLYLTKNKKAFQFPERLVFVSVGTTGFEPVTLCL